MQMIISLRTPDKSSIGFNSLALSELHQTSSLLQPYGVVSLTWAETELLPIFNSLILHNLLE